MVVVNAIKSKENLMKNKYYKKRLLIIESVGVNHDSRRRTTYQ